MIGDGGKAMRLIMTHGYMLSGTGSNVYVQSLCRALVGEGHDLHLICQEPDPLSFDFVNEHATVDAEGVHDQGEKETPFPGRCVVYVPDIGDILPVYVYDDYPGWRVKTFLDLSQEELDNYLGRNVEAVRSVLAASEVEGMITNHSVPGPLIVRRALRDSGIPYVSIVHGSCLQYLSRRSEKYMGLTREGLEGAAEILALSSHSVGTVAEDFPDLTDRIKALPGGVDTKLFNPEAFDLGVVEKLNGGPGRGPDQRSSLQQALGSSGNATELTGTLREISASYDARAHDSDAGERIRSFLDREGPIVVYVGKLIHSKGVHSLLSAFARVRKQTGARLLVIGFGTFREGLEALTCSLSEGDETTVERLAEMGKLLEGGPAGPLEHFELSDELLADAAGMADDVLFTGPIYHGDLPKLLPAADAAAVPSIFPEAFGLVAAEFAASGVVPFVANHSGLTEAGGIVGQGLPFDLRVGMDDFEENLAKALTDYLGLPAEERRRCEEIVRRNSVEDLSWGTLAEKLVALVR
jgi:glycosyltransferase involved in cell wall biosynthesis